MFITDPEYDFWPWSWTHNGKVCETLESMIDAWKSIDPYKDTTFSSLTLNHANQAGDPMKVKIAHNIYCISHHIPTGDKISIKDYKKYALGKFDQQMQKIANKHKKIILGLSGGIDSTLTLAWLIKNRVDFETFIVRNDPWRGEVNKMAEDNAIKMSHILGIKNHIIDFNEKEYDKHNMIKRYCSADEYDLPVSNLMTLSPFYKREKTFDAKIVAPLGTDDLLLHTPDSWKRFIPDDIFHSIMKSGHPYIYIGDFGYHVGGFNGWKKKIDPNPGVQLIPGWEDDLLYSMHKDSISSPATSQQWYENWHRIDPMSCDASELQDIMAVDWLKKQVAAWSTSDIVPLIKGVRCAENNYSPNQSNRSFLLSECERFYKKFHDNKDVEQQVFWRNAIRSMKLFDKISSTVVHCVHILNWLEKNR